MSLENKSTTQLQKMMSNKLYRDEISKIKIAIITVKLKNIIWFSNLINSSMFKLGIYQSIRKNKIKSTKYGENNCYKKYEIIINDIPCILDSMSEIIREIERPQGISTEIKEMIHAYLKRF